MIKNIKRLFCAHRNCFAYRRYDDFEFTEFFVCEKCGVTLDTLKGYDEDLRG